MGLTFQVEPSNTDEVLEPGLTPQQEVVHLSLEKPRQWPQAIRRRPLCSADTVVELDGKNPWKAPQ